MRTIALMWRLRLAYMPRRAAAHSSPGTTNDSTETGATSADIARDAAQGTGEDRLVPQSAAAGAAAVYQRMLRDTWPRPARCRRRPTPPVERPPGTIGATACAHRAFRDADQDSVGARPARMYGAPATLAPPIL